MIWRNKIDEELSIEEIQKQLEGMIEEHRPFCTKGKVADYIPLLAEEDPNQLTASLCLTNGKVIEAGNVGATFTMQSASKVITLALALMDVGEEEVFDKVGMEPSGDPFHSIYRLETMEPNKPLNPMINAGAIAVTSMIHGATIEEKLGRLLSFVQELAANANITFNEQVAQSEAETAHLNRALAYFLKEHGVIEGKIEDILEVYFKQCAIEVQCRDLARIGAVFANYGQDVETNQQLIPVNIARICKTFMITCGMYNASGEFAIRVGIPAKSGVSGCILGAIPYQLGLAVYGPALDSKGNSIAGVNLLESMSKRWQLNIF